MIPPALSPSALLKAILSLHQRDIVGHLCIHTHPLKDVIVTMPSRPSFSSLRQHQHVTSSTYWRDITMKATR